MRVRGREGSRGDKGSDQVGDVVAHEPEDRVGGGLRINRGAPCKIPIRRPSALTRLQKRGNREEDRAHLAGGAGADNVADVGQREALCTRPSDPCKAAAPAMLCLYPCRGNPGVNCVAKKGVYARRSVRRAELKGQGGSLALAWSSSICLIGPTCKNRPPRQTRTHMHSPSCTAPPPHQHSGPPPRKHSGRKVGMGARSRGRQGRYRHGRF